MIRKIAVLTSGGDAPGMNAAIRAVVRAAIANNIKPFVVFEGFRGLVENQIKEVDRSFVSEIIYRGGTIIRSSRLPEFKESGIREIALKNLKNLEIDLLVVIGGDGSYHGGLALENMGFPVICLPGTIDNDIRCTDYTIGFDTALTTIIESVDKLRDTSSSHHRCSIVEVMGRYCGDLALYAGIATGAEMIVTVEHSLTKQEILEQLRKDRLSGKRHAIVIIAEHVIDVISLAKEVEKYSGFETRATILGHVQRGGQPTAFDRVLAGRMGIAAIELAVKGIHGVAIGIKGTKITHETIEKVLSTERTDKVKMYNDAEKLK